MTDAIDLLPQMLADGPGFHVAEWITEGWDSREVRWIPTEDVGWLTSLMRSRVAYRCDLNLSAIPYVHKGSFKLNAHAGCLWVRTDTGDAMKRLARFRPHPTLVLREGGTVRTVAFWALSTGVTPDEAERWNRRLSYALHTKPMHCDPSFRFSPPGVVLRRGRKRPVPVVVAYQSEALYDHERVVGKLKDRPLPPDPREWIEQKIAKAKT